jgi:6-phosphogluconate dehydrogenase
MQIGMIGLGKMGGNMAERLRRAGHDVVGYTHSPGKGDVDTLAELKDRLSPPRTAWLMIPAGEPTRQTITELNGLLDPGDLVIDGGNSHGCSAPPGSTSSTSGSPAGSGGCRTATV